jgi:hypothetical protein
MSTAMPNLKQAISQGGPMAVTDVVNLANQFKQFCENLHLQVTVLLILSYLHYLFGAGNFHVLVPQCRELLSGLVHLAKNTPGPKHHLEKSLEGCYGSWGALLANSLPDLLRNAKATRASAALQAAISFLQRRSLASEKLSTWRLTQLEDRVRDMESWSRA